MNKKLKDKLVHLLSVILVVVISMTVQGCYSKNNNIDKNENLEYVKFKMYLVGDKPKDFDKVYSEVNKIMKKEINAELAVEFLPWSSLSEKYSLLFQSGEEFDLIFTAQAWGHYEEVARKHGFYKLTEEMISKYAPDIYENEPEIAWQQAKINDDIYMVPADQVEYDTRVFGIRGDIVEKYGIDNIDNYEDLERYMDAASKEKDSKMYVVANGGGQNLQYPYMIERYGFQMLNGAPRLSIGFDVNDDSGNIFAFVDTPEYREYAYKMKEFADKGYWDKNSIVNESNREEDFRNGKSSLMVWNIGSVSETVERINKKNPAWKAQVVDQTKGINRTIAPYTNNGIAINARCRNPERALMALNLLRYNKEIHELTWYGIEGVHWNAEGDYNYSEADESYLYPPTSVCSWGWYSRSINRVPSNTSNIAKDVVDDWSENYTVENKLTYFSFDNDKVKNECASVNNVIKQYGIPIDLGMCSDVDYSINEYREKLKEAGLDVILEECRKQIDTYLKEQNE